MAQFISKFVNEYPDIRIQLLISGIYLKFVEWVDCKLLKILDINLERFVIVNRVYYFVKQ